MSKKVHFPSNPDLLKTEHDQLNAADQAVEQAVVEDKGVGLASIVIMLCVNFLANVVFSIVIPSIWPFLQVIYNNDAPKYMVGWAVACNSAGTFISAPLLGAWADKWKTRPVMAFGLLLMILGNFCYSLAHSVFSKQVEVNVAMLLVGRFVVGFAAGNYAVIQSYFSYATKPSQRLAVMSWNAGTTVLGFIFGPAIAAACVFNFSIGPIVVDNVTGPGYLSAVAALIAMFALLFLEDVPRPSAVQAAAAAKVMAEQQAKKDTAKSAEKQALLGTGRSSSVKYANSVANHGSWIFGGSGFYDQPIADEKDVNNATNKPAARKRKRVLNKDGTTSVATKDSSQLIANIDNANDEQDDQDDALSAAQARARTWAGYARNASVPTYGSVAIRNDEPLESNVPTPWGGVIVSLFLNFIFTLPFTCLETVGPPYTGNDPDLRWGVVQNGIYFCVMGLICIVSLVLLQVVSKFLIDRVLLVVYAFMMTAGYATNVSYSNDANGNANFPPLWCFYLSSVLTGVGYAAGAAVLLSIYSKILDGLDQGAFMGWFTASTSVARIVGPLVASYVLADDVTARYMFAGVAGLLLISAFTALFSMETLKPRAEKEADEDENAVN